MNPLKDITGKVYGRLTVVEIHDRSIKTYTDMYGAEVNIYKTRWLCKCECGNTKVVEGRALKRGSTKSCGCMRQGRKWGVKRDK